MLFHEKININVEHVKKTLTVSIESLVLLCSYNCTGTAGTRAFNGIFFLYTFFF